MAFRSYRDYGIDPEWVGRLKRRAKEPLRKERLKGLAEGVTKEDLQDPETVERLLIRAFKTLGVQPTPRQLEQTAAFILDQEIDPDNMLHLLRLWSMFR